MSIPARRFEFLNKETNIGVMDYINVHDSGLRGKSGRDDTSGLDKSLTAAKEEVANKLTDLVKPAMEAKSAVDNMVASIKNMLPDMDMKGIDLKGLFRQTKGVLGLMGDMAKMPSKVLDGMLSKMFPNNPLAKGIAGDVFKICDSMGSGLGNMKPYNAGIDCNGKNLKGSKGNCKPAGVSNLLDAITGGSYSKGIRDVNSMINGVVALATSTYKANMCGGFSSSIGGLNGNKSAIDRAGAMIMTALGSKHNIRGMLDVLKDANGSNIGKQVPGLVKNLLGKPLLAAKEYGKDKLSKITEQFGGDTRDAKGIFTGVKDGASLLDKNWDKNAAGQPSIAKVVDSNLTSVKSNTGFSGLTLNSLQNNPLSLNNLNSVNNDLSDSLCTAYSTYSV